MEDSMVCSNCQELIVFEESLQDEMKDYDYMFITCENCFHVNRYIIKYATRRS